MKELKYKMFIDQLSGKPPLEQAPDKLARFIEENNIKKEDIISINNDEGIFYLFYYSEV